MKRPGYRLIYLSSFTIMLAFLWAACDPARAGLGTTIGNERGLWTTYRYSVIAATIRDVRPNADPSQPNRATLLPIATFAGTLDPSLNPKLEVRFYVGDRTSSVKGLPPDGATVLVAVIVGRHHADEKEGSDWIDSDLVAFMPNQSALVVIKGIDDPLVTQTLEKIRVARGAQKPEPTTRGK
jgi:hypothetical protein